MNEGKDNIVVHKSYAFALQIIQLYKSLVEKKEYVLSKQIVRSGTSLASESKKDFIHKLGIALKEARETSYWLNLLKDSKYISNDEFNKLNNSCYEIIKILNSIILTTKKRYFANS